jgi:hypothetical protein
MEDEEAMNKGLGGTPIYRTMTTTKAVCTSWQSIPFTGLQTWDAWNMMSYTAEESCHKYRAEYAGFFPGRHAKYLVGT